MASSACCAAGTPLFSEYTRQGSMEQVGDMNVYVTGTGAAAILVCPDIFGHEFNQVFQVCDRLAAQGFVVACPDVFLGRPWSMADFPPSDGAKFMEWVGSVGETVKVVGLLEKTRDMLQASRNVAAFACLGFCWGASVSLACAEKEGFYAVACCHPAFFGKEADLARAARVPVCILPAKGDPMEDAKAVLDGKPFAEKCVYQRFDDQEHGFMAARGDWSKPEVAAAAGRGLDILSHFFTANMPVLMHERLPAAATEK